MAETWLLKTYREARQAGKEYGTIEKKGKYITVKNEVVGFGVQLTITSTKPGFISAYLLSPRTKEYINKKLNWIGTRGFGRTIKLWFPTSGVNVEKFGYPKEWYFIVTLWDRPGGKILDQVRLPAIPPLITRERVPPRMGYPQYRDIIQEYVERVREAGRRRAQIESELRELEREKQDIIKAMIEARRKGQTQKVKELEKRKEQIEEEIKRKQEEKERYKDVWSMYRKELEKTYKEVKEREKERGEVRLHAVKPVVEVKPVEGVPPEEGRELTVWDRVKLFLYDNWQWIALAGAGVGAGAVAYYLYKRFKR